MKKQEIISHIENKAKLSDRKADETLEAIVDHIVNALARGESVNLVGFGSFVVKSRKSRQGRNPSTGEVITIPETNTVVFKAAKAIKTLTQ